MESFQGISFQGEEWRRIIQIGAPFIWTLDLGPWTDYGKGLIPTSDNLLIPATLSS